LSQDHNATRTTGSLVQSLGCGGAADEMGGEFGGHPEGFFGDGRNIGVTNNNNTIPVGLTQGLQPLVEVTGNGKKIP
jgi:hypothetical protein